MSDATWMLLGVAALVAVASIGIVAGMRFIGRRFGLTQFLQDGVVLTPEGLQLWPTRRNVIPYSEIESAVCMPYLDGMVSILLLRYGMSVRWCLTRHFHDIVVVKFRRPRRLRYLVCTPRDSHRFVKELSSRLEPPEHLG